MRAELDAIDIGGMHRRFRAAIIPKYTREVGRALEAEYVRIAGPERKPLPRGDGGPRDTWAAANRQLKARHDQLTRHHAHIAFSAADIADKARRCVWHCRRASRNLSKMESVAEHAGIEPPDPEKHTERGRKNRLTCERWWRRQLHRHYSQAAEGALRDLGLVNRRRGLYCSDSSVKRRRDQQSRQRDLLREIIATNDLGDQLTLLELAESSVSNPTLRRAELMTRIRGFDEVAEVAGHVGEFYTFTTPSRFHAYHTNGARNPKYRDGLTPRDAQLWLRRQWARIRAKLKRLSIRVYGFRVAEPHHDGTTHWHLLLFMPEHQAGAVRKICAGYLLSDDGDERGATWHRFKAVRVDRERGSAAGYVAKYIAKNIDGHEVGADYESAGESASDTAARVDAWASTWSIRQFQQIGGPPVGLWRELRRIRDTVDCDTMERARAAADAGEWRQFIDALGGIEASRSGPVALEKETTGEVNQYDELKAAQIVGVTSGLLFVATRERLWVFAFRPIEAPWTRVNNCTHDGSTPATEITSQRDPP